MEINKKSKAWLDASLNQNVGIGWERETFRKLKFAFKDATERMQITNEWPVWQKLPKLPEPPPFPTDWLREIELSKGVQQSIISI